MISKSRILRLRRFCSLMLAIGYACLTLIVPLHTHVHGSKAASSKPVFGANANHSGFTLKSAYAKVNASQKSIHCALCEWEALVTFQASPQFVVQPLQVTSPRIDSQLSHAADAKSIVTSSRGPPRA